MFLHRPRLRRRMGLDFVAPWQTPAFPADAIVWISGWADLTAVAAPMAVRSVRVRRAETPRATPLAS